MISKSQQILIFWDGGSIWKIESVAALYAQTRQVDVPDRKRRSSD